MKNEIKIRQKRVLVWILIAALLWNHVTPIEVQAATVYDISTSTTAIKSGDIIYPEDSIKCASQITIEYYDADGTTPLTSGTFEEEDSLYIHEVISYTNATNGNTPQLSASEAWKASVIYVSGVVTNINLTAVPSHSITYNNVEEASNSNPTTYVEGVGVTAFEDPTREGYRFDGWYSNAEFTGNPVTSIGTTETEAVTLYAKWTPNTYNISYKNSDGTDIAVNKETNPSTYIYGVGVSSLGVVEKEGYTFNGWYSEAKGGTKIESISKTQTGEVTLYAQYTPNDYDITYVLDGGTNASGNPNSYTYGEGVESFEKATKPGYTFDGWYSDAAFNTKVTSISTTQMQEVTLYAKFTANKYKINYELNGGTNSESNPTEYTYGVDSLQLSEARKDGYTFEGWYSDADFTTKVESIDTTQLQDVTLYAKFTAEKYAITYELNGGTNASTNPVEYTYEVGVEEFAAASRVGYTFDGWYRDAEFLNPSTSIGTTETGAITLYAKWTAETYNISYKNSDGTDVEVDEETNPSTYTYGEGVSNLGTVEKEGYTFDGWYTDAEFSINVESISESQTGDITLYAKWTETVTEAEPDVPMEETPTDTVEPDTPIVETQPVEPEPNVPTEETSTEEAVVIESGGTVSLEAGTAYVLGTGTWKIAGDDTIYAGDMTFYVAEDTECEFVKQ